MCFKGEMKGTQFIRCKELLWNRILHQNRKKAKSAGFCHWYIMCKSEKPDKIEILLQNKHNNKRQKIIIQYCIYLLNLSPNEFSTICMRSANYSAQATLLIACMIFLRLFVFTDVNVLWVRFEFGQSSFWRPAGNLEHNCRCKCALIGVYSNQLHTHRVN